jgi:hypothetical protein
MQFELVYWEDMIAHYPTYSVSYISGRLENENKRIIGCMLAEISASRFPQTFLVTYLRLHIRKIGEMLDLLDTRLDTEKKAMVNDLLCALNFKIQDLIKALSPTEEQSRDQEYMALLQQDPVGHCVFRVRITDRQTLAWVKEETKKIVDGLPNSHEKTEFLKGVIGYRKYLDSQRPGIYTAKTKLFDAKFQRWLQTHANSLESAGGALGLKLTYSELGVFFSCLQRLGIFSESRHVKLIALKLEQIFRCKSEGSRAHSAFQIQESFYYSQLQVLQKVQSIAEKMSKELEIMKGECLPEDQVTVLQKGKPVDPLNNKIAC